MPYDSNTTQLCEYIQLMMCYNWNQLLTASVVQLFNFLNMYPVAAYLIITSVSHNLPSASFCGIWSLWKCLFAHVQYVHIWTVFVIWNGCCVACQ